ncbi:MAG: J domain-containing protein [Blastocatellales bacterium]
MGDLYAVLGVKRTATSSEIKSAYRRLARKYHPDVNSDPSAPSKFAQVNEAYNTLIDPERRKSYDRTGSVSSAAYARRANSAAAARAARRAYYQERADRIVNEWLQREREETRARGKAVYTTVTLFVSTFIVAMNPGLFEPTGVFWTIALLLFFAIGVRHLYTSLKEHFDHYTYRPPRISVTRPTRRSNKRFKRSVAWGFVIIGYLLSVGAGVLIGLLTQSFSSRLLGDTDIGDALLYALVYPPIAVLIVDTMYRINLRFEDL